MLRIQNKHIFIFFSQGSGNWNFEEGQERLSRMLWILRPIPALLFLVFLQAGEGDDIRAGMERFFVFFTSLVVLLWAVTN